MSVPAAAAAAPGLTDVCRVVDRAENEFGRPIISRTDIRYVRLTVQQLLGAAKVAELQHAGALVN